MEFSVTFDCKFDTPFLSIQSYDARNGKLLNENYICHNAKEFPESFSMHESKLFALRIHIQDARSRRIVKGVVVLSSKGRGMS